MGVFIHASNVAIKRDDLTFISHFAHDQIYVILRDRDTASE